ncbi:DUF3667 domain-containing protein [Ekhidna lutea]|nr:DUF3667 domain-containing protein [Ekhidna lutea]
MEVKRVSFRTIAEEFFSKWIGFDNQFGRTVLDMTIRPGIVVNAYLSGNRTRYIGPLGYVVIMTALLIISFDLFGLEVGDFLKQNSDTFNPAGNQAISEDQAKMQQSVMEFMAKNFRFMAAIMIPFFAISLGWFYRREKLNYIERAVVTTYLSCHGMWITMAMLGILALSGHLFNVTGMILSIVYYAFALHKCFPRRNFMLGFVKTVGVYVSAILLFTLFALIVGIGIGILIAIFNPEMIQS